MKSRVRPSAPTPMWLTFPWGSAVHDGTQRYARRWTCPDCVRVGVVKPTPRGRCATLPHMCGVHRGCRTVLYSTSTHHGCIQKVGVDVHGFTGIQSVTAADCLGPREGQDLGASPQRVQRSISLWTGTDSREDAGLQLPKVPRSRQIGARRHSKTPRCVTKHGPREQGVWNGDRQECTKMQ